MNARCLKGLVVILVLCVLAVGTRDVRAAVDFSGVTWTALTDPCDDVGVYTEPHNDFPGAPGQHEWDIVGDETHAAGFRGSDATNLYFRMRVDYATTTVPPGVWQFLLDFTKDGNVDWSLQLDNKVDDAVELVPASPGNPLFAQVNLSHTANDGHWSGSIADFSKISGTADGVELGDTWFGDAADGYDSFVYVAIPWSEFTAKTGKDSTTLADWRVYLTTSASHIQVNKDTPLCVGPPAVPEPTSLLIWSVLGALGILSRRRR